MVARAAFRHDSVPESPDFLTLHSARPERYPYLLESVSGAHGQGRYDLLFASSGETLALDAEGRLDGPQTAESGFLTHLDAWWRRLRANQPGDLPFQGGWFVFAGYELAGEIEPGLRLPRPDTGFPVAFAARCPAGLVRNKRTGVVTLVCEPGFEALGEQLREDAQTVQPAAAPAPVAWRRLEEDPPEAYLDAVARIREYIRAGDVFQVNVSREWRAECGSRTCGGQLYEALRRTNPAPFAGLARWGDDSIVSSSPERLVEVRDGRVQTRPIAGTTARTAGPGAPGAADALLRHPKERAEHIMLIDLERNDLGRVCVPGSVDVNELMVLESYAHVHHIVSNVRGELMPETPPGDVLRAVFPGGTITGCPKVRCMEIIAELERTARGPYTGTMGYLNRNGDMDFNILIRSVLQQGRHARFRAGGGIVADSRPGPELAETRAKARGLLLALGIESRP